MRSFFLSLLVALSFMACQNRAAQSSAAPEATYDSAADTLRYPGEANLRNIRQLTFGGDNAEAYFSFNNKYLVFQSNFSDWGVQCDQIFYMPLSGAADQRPPMVSTGRGRTTCSFFMPGDNAILYASTHDDNDACPEVPRLMNGKYVWGIFSGFDIYVADLNGSILRRLTDTPGYDAEATLSPDGKKIVFTSMRSGDLELYTMDTDGSNVRQITSELGYDGGAFFSPDGSKIVFRASRPKTDEEKRTYTDLLAQGLVQPGDMEIFVCNADGSDLRQITRLGKANWAPYFHPSGRSILFSSNHHSESGRQFNIFSIDLDGGNLRQITFDDTFDAFPMFSYDGRKLVFASNRYNGGTRDTNIFVADWVD